MKAKFNHGDESAIKASGIDEKEFHIFLEGLDKSFPIPRTSRVAEYIEQIYEHAEGDTRDKIVRIICFMAAHSFYDYKMNRKSTEGVIVQIVNGSEDFTDLLERLKSSLEDDDGGDISGVIGEKLKSIIEKCKSCDKDECPGKKLPILGADNNCRLKH